MEYETLDLEEVKKVIKGEPIRSIREVLESDNVGVEEEKRMTPSTTAAPNVGQQPQTATQARGV